MKIAYENTLCNNRTPIVLIRSGNSRVELHIKQEQDFTCSLLAFSGNEGSNPGKTAVQGPYEIFVQAIAARNAIINELIRSGYQVDLNAVSIWSLHAQRQIIERRKLKEASVVDCKFDPKDVFLDW